MKKILVALLMLIAGPAFADSTINALGSASSLTGTESVPIFQTANPAVKTTTQAIANLLQGSNSTFTGTNIFSGGVTLGGTTFSGITGSTQCLHVNTSGVLSGTGSDCGAGGGSGTVTSVALTMPGIFSVGGSPITTSGTLAVTASGTSGGIPYFSGASTLASSAALTANAPVIGGGAGVAPSVGTRSGNTTTFVTTTGSLTTNDCVKIDASGNFIDNGSTCGGGGGTPGGSSGQVQYNNAGAFGGFTVGGDGTLNTGTGALTVTKTNGVSFGTAATQNTGTSGATIPLLNGNNTYSGTSTFTGNVSHSGTTTFTGSLSVPTRVVTAAGAVTVSATTDFFVCINKTVGAATTVNLPSSPATGLYYKIKDCKGDAATNNITVTPAAGTIDGGATAVINSPYAAIDVIYNGTEWSVN